MFFFLGGLSKSILPKDMPKFCHITQFMYRCGGWDCICILYLILNLQGTRHYRHFWIEEKNEFWAVLIQEKLYRRKKSHVYCMYIVVFRIGSKTISHIFFRFTFPFLKIDLKRSPSQKTRCSRLYYYYFFFLIKNWLLVTPYCQLSVGQIIGDILTYKP